MQDDSAEWYALKWVLDKLNQAITEDVKTLEQFSKSNIFEWQAAIPFWTIVVNENRKMRDLLLEFYGTTLEEMYAQEVITDYYLDVTELD